MLMKNDHTILTTPFGNVVLTMDNKAVSYSCECIHSERYFPDVDGAFMLRYEFVNDGKEHTLACQLERMPGKGAVESGQQQEAISFWIGQGKLTIACEGDFGLPNSGYDFDGNYTDAGICLHLSPRTASRVIWFGVAWLEKCTAENDVQTWLAADTHRLHPID